MPHRRPADEEDGALLEVGEGEDAGDRGGDSDGEGVEVEEERSEGGGDGGARDRVEEDARGGAQRRQRVG